MKAFSEIVSNNELLSKCICWASWEHTVKCEEGKKKNPLLSSMTVCLVHRIERVSMTDRQIKRERETQAVPLKEDAIQLDNDSVYLHGGLSTQRKRYHVCYLSVCLSAFLSACLSVCNLTGSLSCSVTQTAN